MARECAAVGCRTSVPRARVFCDACSALLQSDIRALIERGYRPGQHQQSAVFDQHLQQALEEILYAKLNGHRAPREADFQW